jgi:hypothetical protein
VPSPHSELHHLDRVRRRCPVTVEWLVMANPATELRDLTRVQIYNHFIETGRAPTTADIAGALGRDATEVDRAIADLADAHTIVLAPGSRSIWMAHPFSAVPTLYPVVSGVTSYGRTAHGTLTRNANFAKRPDVLERVLPIFFADLPRGGRRNERFLLDEVIAARDSGMSYLTICAGSLVTDINRIPDGLPTRFQDFAKILAVLDMCDLESCLEALETSQALAINDPDELSQALTKHLPECGMTGNATEIVRQLTAMGAKLPDLGGGKAIARKLRELKPLLDRAGIRVRETNTPEHTAFNIYRTQK